MEIKKLLPNYVDDRGEIIDIVINNNITSVTLITFKKNSIRANHYHKETIQWNLVLKGKIKLVTQIKDGDIVETILNKGMLAKTLEYEKHALKALEESEVLIITKGPRSGDQYILDTFPLDKKLI